MSDVRLIVGGRRYSGWKSVRITRSIETIAGSFNLEVSDRWAEQSEPWPIAEGDVCRVEIDDETVIEGFVDRRSQSITATARRLAYTGRDRAAALVDCSAVLDRWTFRKATVVDVARKVAEPFGVDVFVQPGLELLPAPAKLVVSPGDSAWQAIQRAAQPAGVMVVSDGAGGLLITRSGTERAEAIAEGQNLLAGSVDYDTAHRYHRYVVVAQVGGTDQASGGATRIRAEAIDESVTQTERVLLIRPSSGVTTDYARQRADWEARIRAARAETVKVSVQGWRQPNGRLWPINALVPVRAPSIGVNGDLLISQAEHALSASGEVTQLRLVRPDAFTPEPKEAKVKSSGGRWKEIAGGV